MTDDIVARLVRRVEELRKYQRVAAELSDKVNGTPCAEIRWQQELDAALARAEAAERERDWHKSLTQSHDLLADNAALKARANAAEANVAKLREALTFYARHTVYRISTVYMSGSRGMTEIECDGGSKARLALQEIEQ